MPSLLDGYERKTHLQPYLKVSLLEADHSNYKAWGSVVKKLGIDVHWGH